MAGLLARLARVGCKRGGGGLIGAPGGAGVVGAAGAEEGCNININNINININ